MTLAREMETYIHTLKNSRIQQFLKSHLNQKAQSTGELFCLNMQPDKKIASKLKEDLPFTSPLAMFFAGAAPPLAAELLLHLKALDQNEAALMMSKSCKVSGKIKSGFYSIYKYAKHPIRIALSEWILSWSEENLFTIFKWQMEEDQRSIHVLLDETIVPVKNICEALKRLSPLRQLHLFEAPHTLFASYPFFMDILGQASQRGNEDKIFVLLDLLENLLKKLPEDLRRKLVHEEKKKEGEPHLFTQIMERRADKLSTKILDLILLLPHDMLYPLMGNQANQLLIAQSLHHFLKNSPSILYPDRCPHNISSFSKSLQSIPHSIDLLWAGENALSHVAVQKKKDRFLEALLQAGANPNVYNGQQLTPLQIAIQQQDSICIALLVRHKKTTFTLLQADGSIDLLYPVHTLSYPLAKVFLENLGKYQSTETVAQFFAATLPQLSQAPSIRAALEGFLNKEAKSGSLRDHLDAYCDAEEDCSALCLLHAARPMSLSKERIVRRALLDFVRQELAAFHHADSLLEKDAAKNALFLFFFALQAGELSALLHDLNLSSEEGLLLQPLFSHILVQPLVYSRVDYAQYQILQRGLCLQESSLLFIAVSHLKNANLALLPPEILQEHAKKLTAEELFLIQQNRLNGCLMVLSLDKELSNPESDEGRIASLKQALATELQRLNQEGASLDSAALRAMLQLAIHPSIQALIQDFIQKNASVKGIQNALMQLFRDFEGPVLQKSFLREWYFSLATKEPLLMGEKENQAGFMAWLSDLSTDEVNAVMRQQMQTMRPRMWLDALPHKASLSRWLHPLPKRALRLEIRSLATALAEIRLDIIDFSESLEDSACSSLQKSLWQFEDSCEEVGRALLACPFEDQSPAHVLLDAARDLLFKDCFGSVSVLESGKDLLIKEKNEAFYVDLKSTLEEKMGIGFFQKMQALRLSLEGRQRAFDQESEQLWSSHVELAGLRPLFQEGAKPCHEALLEEKATAQAIFLRKKLLVLFQGLKEAILNRQDKEALQAQWLAWQQSIRHRIPLDVFLKEWIPSIQALTPEALSLFTEEEDRLLASHEALAPFIGQLQSQGSWHQWLECLMSANIHTLQELAQLTLTQGLADLHRLIVYAIDGKRHSWTVSELCKTPMPTEWREIQSWIGGCFAALERAKSVSLAVKAMIAAYYRNSNNSKAQSEGLTNLSQLLKTYKTAIPSEAMALIISSYQSVLEADLLSPLAIKSVHALALWMQDASVELQDGLLLVLDDRLLKQLLEHCLSGISSDDPERAGLCKTLLFALCRGDNAMREEQIKLIRDQLGNKNLEILAENSLIKFGNEILFEKPSANLQDNVYQGVWIQRLLLSPAFMASLPLEKWPLLIERYRALSLILKQDEFAALNHALSAKLHPYHWQNTVFMDEAFQKHCKAKQKRLLLFRADDSIRALLIQLEENCLSLQASNPELAKAALDNLYTYYNQELKGMQGTFLFRLADYFYTQVVRSKGDLGAKNFLRSWLEKKVPHYNFFQRELVRKKERILFDESGKKIGYLDELNYVFTLEKRIPLLDAGFAEGQVFYDKKRQRIGTLLPNGQCRQDNIFQSKSSALLVSTMSIQELALSPYALELLFEDIFHENALPLLFEKTAPQSEKGRWLQEQIVRRLAMKKEPLSKKLLEDVAQFLEIDALLQLLQNSHASNAGPLFHAILLQEDKRQALFSAANSLEMAAFFRHVSPVKTLADYLQRYVSEPWFHQGLLLFTPIPKANILSHALDGLTGDLREKRLEESHFDTIMQKLIGEEEVAKIVLHGFLSEPSDPTLFYPHVSKAHLLPVLPELQVKNKNARYQLVLAILGAECEQLFQDLEPILSKQSWSAEEVKMLGYFVNAHVRKNPLCPIGQKILAKLVFRSAHFGQTSLFYKKPKAHSSKPPSLIPSLVTASLKRSLLDAFVARFYVTRVLKQMKEGLSESMKTVLQWFKGNYRQHEARKKLLRDLQANNALRDWKKMAEVAWKEVDGTSLPILSAFLLHFSGDSESLGLFLEDVLQNNSIMQEKNGILHNLSSLMAHYPDRDVSYVIFYAIEKALLKNHALMDKKLFENMAAFYVGKKGGGLVSPEEKLLQRFGQNQWYALTKHAANLLLVPSSRWQSFKRFFTGQSTKEKTIKKVAKEAHVEALLQPHIKGYFFGVRKFFVRVWHRTRAGRTHLVKLCEDMSIYDPGDKKITKVNTPMEQGGESREAVHTRPANNRPNPSQCGIFARSLVNNVTKINNKMNDNEMGLVPAF